MAQDTRVTIEKKEQFLDILSHGWSVVRAAEICGVNRKSFYVQANNDKAFADAWKESKHLAQQRREDELNLRAYHGEDLPVMKDGEIVMIVDEDGVKKPLTYKGKKSDLLLMFSMKAEDPDKYKDKSAVEHQGLEGLAAQFKALQDASEKADIEAEKRSNTESDKPTPSPGDGEMP